MLFYPCYHRASVEKGVEYSAKIVLLNSLLIRIKDLQK